ncbi:hypothetical protein GLP43_15150 [Sulfitobacter sp. M39]|uniref:hypothetical protein n=1 Tax=Sulfitobacter sp. M39 TaxID=2675334 RepID=UPI001F491782|nr:hypothetical protein [Sulfitobacter sp. M39]MCF7748896.1 hypothetical protein [Sulfitobacter sp. M39]
MFTDASAQVANLTVVFVCVNAYNAEGDTILLDWLVTDEQATHTKLLSEYQALEEEYARQDEHPEIDTQLGVLEAEIQKIEIRPLAFNPTDIGRAGAFVMFDRYGALAVSRGYDRLTSDESVEDGNTA